MFKHVKRIELLLGLALSLAMAGCGGQAGPHAFVAPAAQKTDIPVQVETEMLPVSPMPAISETPIAEEVDFEPLPSAVETEMPSTATAKAPPTKQAAPTEKAAPTKTPKPTILACWRLGGRIETGTLRTTLLRLPLGYRVYLPPCYNQQTERRYPVLYLVHGQSYNDDQWERLGAGKIEDRLVPSGELPPFIIVMPYDRYGGEPTESGFGQAVMEVLMPYVDETYRTIPDRKHRAVGGLSRGAGWAVHFGIGYWELFGAVGGHSPAIFHTDAMEMRTWLDAIPPGSAPRIYLDIGDRDRPVIMESAIWFEKLLDEKDIPHEWYLFSGFHNEEYWSSHLEGYLRWYAQEWYAEVE